MKGSELNLRRDESVVLALRALYTKYGYTPYKMSKFEDYELYARNKDFLVSDNVITFNDIGGRLMALKPDVTLSIVKNTADLPGCVQKVYYNENVYRVSARTHRFSEIMQTGLECIGDLDDYCVSEVLMLAAESLAQVSEEAVLDISHLGVLAALLDGLSDDDSLRASILKCVGEKNVHELTALCKEKGIQEDQVAPICRLMTTYGDPQKVLPELITALDGVIDLAPLNELERVIAALPDGLRKLLRVDFSVVNDLNYYNGIVFKGFVPGVPSSVLSGGQYDRLLRKMGRKAGAIGFAVYMDELERLGGPACRYDVDTLLLYAPDEEPGTVRAALETLSKEGVSVSAQREKPEKVRYRRVMRLEKNGEVTELETDA